MDSEKLYRVQEEDLSKLEELLCRSFAADPRMKRCENG